MGTERTPPPKQNPPTSLTQPDGGYPQEISDEGPIEKRQKNRNIIVPNFNHKELVNLLSPFSQNLTMKRSNRGTTVITDSLESQAKVISFLKENKINCFSSGNQDTASLKFILYGLYDYSESEVKEELCSRNLPVTSIKKFNTKPSLKRDTFLVCFKQSSSLSVDSLRKESKLFSTLVEWKVFEEREPRTMQCFNCLRFGHSSSSCKSAAACVICAKPHNKSECPLPKLENGKVDSKYLRCALCSGQHTASFSGCPARVDYISAQEKTQRAPSKQPTAQFQECIAASATWPSLSKTVPKRPSWSQMPVWNSGTSDLLADEELWKIFLDFSSRLAACNTRNQQIEVVAELAIKYITPQANSSSSVENVPQQNVNKTLTFQTSNNSQKDLSKSVTNTQPGKISSEVSNLIEGCDDSVLSSESSSETGEACSSAVHPRSIASELVENYPPTHSDEATPLEEAAQGIDPGADSTRVLRSAKSGPR